MVNHDGWTCPTCRRNYAPWMPSCNCINSAVGVNTTSITITPHADDTAALVAAVESGLHYIKWAEEHGHMGAPSSRTLIEAVLAQVKGGERS